MLKTPYEVKPSPGQGLGMFATRDIAVGELIVAENPLVVASPFNCLSVVESLPAAQKSTFYALTDFHTPNSPTPSGIMRTHALPLGPDSIRGGIFPDICRVNHSCLPNVHHLWNSKRGQETIHAILPISVGEEILTAYIPSSSPRSDLQSALKAKFGFVCECQACRGVLNPASDVRRAKIAELDDTIASVGGRNFTLGYQLAKQRVRYLDAEGLADQSDKGRSLYDAFQMCVVSLDFPAARRQAGLANGNSVMAEGEDSDNTIKFKAYWQNPKSHPNAAIGWKQNIPMLCDACGSVAKSTCKGCSCAVYCDADCAKGHNKWHEAVCRAIRIASS